VEETTKQKYGKKINHHRNEKNEKIQLGFFFAPHLFCCVTADAAAAFAFPCKNCVCNISSIYLTSSISLGNFIDALAVTG
jgi:hypothetical protein